MNRRDKKAYGRLDGNLMLIPSSIVYRKSMPKTGKWVEISEAYQCCNTTTTTTTSRVETPA